MIKMCDLCKSLHMSATYDKTKTLKKKFKGFEKINKNYSQIYQDIFVLSVLDGKENGSYLEIGAGDEIVGSNSYLLEKDFNWTGISIDINDSLSIRKNRSNPIIIGNAITINYKDLIFNNFINTSYIDYLQIDCDPPKNSYEILKNIPFETTSFGIITFEHDYFADNTKKYRELSREYLLSYGYEMIVGNVGVDSIFPFEDWWVNPKFIELEKILDFKNISNKNVCVEEYMLEDFTNSTSYVCDH